MRRRPRLFSSVMIALSALVLPVPVLASVPSEAAPVAYYAPTFAGTLFVTQQGEIVYALSGPRTDAKRDRGLPSSSPGWSLTETLLDGHARPLAQDLGTSGVSTFLGGDPARWRSALPTWEQITLGEVWPGVTVALRARGVTSPSPKLPTDLAEGAKQ